MTRWSDRDEDALVAMWEDEADVTWEVATLVPESLIGA